MQPPLMFQVSEACKRLGIGRTLLYELLRDGQLIGVRIGRRTVIPAAELDRFASDLYDKARRAGEGA